MYPANSDIMFFKQLKQKFNLNRFFFVLATIQSFVKANRNNILIKPPQAHVETLITKGSFKKGIISEFYNMLTFCSSESSR